MTDRSLQRMIHVGCRELGLDADTRHDLQLAVTGKASLRDMTDAELQAVVEALKSRGFKPFGTAARGGRGRPPARRADVRYAHVLWRLMAERGVVRQPGPKGLNAFVRSRFGSAWGSVPIDIDAMTDHRQIADILDALKAMCQRAGVPYRNGGRG